MLLHVTQIVSTVAGIPVIQPATVPAQAPVPGIVIPGVIKIVLLIVPGIVRPPVKMTARKRVLNPVTAPVLTYAPLRVWMIVLQIAPKVARTPALQLVRKLAPSPVPLPAQGAGIKRVIVRGKLNARYHGKQSDRGVRKKGKRNIYDKRHNE